MPNILADIGHIWLRELAPNLSRYATFAISVWLLLWVALGGVLRARKIRSETPPARQMATEFVVSLRSIAIFATVGVGVTLLERTGVYGLANWGTRAGGQPWFWASIVIGIIAHDAYVYWVHRWMHRPRWFRKTHRRHHLSHNPSPFTAYSFDIAEAGLMVAFVLVWPLIFPTHWGAMQWVMIHQIVRNTLVHSGYELMPARRDGRPWLDFLTTTTHHDLHHGEAGWNYAPWFTWWDRWMGTEHPEYLSRYARAAWQPGARAPAEPAVVQMR